MEKENPFKKLGGDEKKVPKDLKDKVMESVALIDLMKDFSSLFTANYANSVSSLFKTQNKHNDDESEAQ